MDGKIIPNVGVTTIINYYESLLIDNPVKITTTSGIESNFMEDMAQEYLDDADF